MTFFLFPFCQNNEKNKIKNKENNNIKTENNNVKTIVEDNKFYDIFEELKKDPFYLSF
tara:strand:- start:81 stop:254 length:174 start_codon:yes stop_codon:yes gene_type:complete